MGKKLTNVEKIEREYTRIFKIIQNGKSKNRDSVRPKLKEYKEETLKRLTEEKYTYESQPDDYYKIFLKNKDDMEKDKGEKKEYKSIEKKIETMKKNGGNYFTKIIKYSSTIEKLRKEGIHILTMEWPDPNPLSILVDITNKDYLQYEFFLKGFYKQSEEPPDLRHKKPKPFKKKPQNNSSFPPPNFNNFFYGSYSYAPPPPPPKPISVKVNYYKILNIPDFSNESVIKTSYRRLALQFHPDKNNTEDAKKKFNDIQQAYSVLGDRDQKLTHDYTLRPLTNSFGSMKI